MHMETPGGGKLPGLQAARGYVGTVDHSEVSNGDERPDGAVVPGSVTITFGAIILLLVIALIAAVAGVAFFLYAVARIVARLYRH